MKYFFLISFFCALVSCDNKKEKVHINIPSSHNNEKCDPDFNLFFKKFASDSVFQKKHVKFPLKESYSDPDTGYETTKTEHINSKDYHYHKFPKKNEASKFENGAFSITVDKQKDTVFNKWRGIDNGIYVDFKFVFIDGCWYMVEIDDQST